MFQKEIRNRVYCIFVTMLLVAGQALAEDDAVDIDPNSPFLGALRDFWGYLTQLLAW